MLKLLKVHYKGFIKAGFAKYSSLIKMNIFKKVYQKKAIQQEDYELLSI